jgi:cytidine deaminase
LSVTVVDVDAGFEADFVTLAGEFEFVMARKNYGRADAVRDEADPQRYYFVRYWAEAEAAQACYADPEVQELNTKLHGIARVLHVINGVRRVEGQPAQPPVPERRRFADADRRSGFDRRVKDVGRPEGDRRVADRRLGPRRIQGEPAGGALIAAAKAARDNADAAFSNFKVGAAIEAADGTVITGCNIENATYGLTICAERVAMFKALSEGHRAFTRIAVVADTEVPTPPCGACRQVLWEFGGNLDVELANLVGPTGSHKLQDLLPLPFDARLLRNGS